MSRTEAKGSITWIDEEIVGFHCECGQETAVSINGGECDGCGKKLTLKQSNTVYEDVKPLK